MFFVDVAAKLDINYSFKLNIILASYSNQLPNRSSLPSSDDRGAPCDSPYDVYSSSSVQYAGVVTLFQAVLSSRSSKPLYNLRLVKVKGKIVQAFYGKLKQRPLKSSQSD